MSDDVPHPESRAAIAARIKLTREAMGLTQTAFAAKCGVSQQQLSNYESGLRRPDIDEAMRMDNRAGIRVEWIYQGVRNRLPADLAGLIDAYEAKQSAAARKRA